jgi:cytochrome c oxidase cbb3-type subunit 3
MPRTVRLVAARISAIMLGAAVCCGASISAQAPAPAPAPAPGPPPPRFPAQMRSPDDPELVARGRRVYDISCRSCHGADLRGGDMGGPNLLRSQIALNDEQGELLAPIITFSSAMPQPVRPSSMRSAVRVTPSREIFGASRAV